MESTIAIVVPFLFLLFISSNGAPAIIPVGGGSGIYNVMDLGAKPDGKTDSSKAFLTAWAAACRTPSPSATIFVPPGRFLIKQMKFGGACKNKAIVFTIFGTLVAPSDYNVIGNSGYWIYFQGVDGVSIRGGILDGQGTGLWDCKNSGKKNCPMGATVTTKITFP